MNDLETRRFPASYGSRESEHAARIAALEKCVIDLAGAVVALEAKAREIGPNTPIGPGLMPQPYRAVTDDETALMIEAAKKAMGRETIRAASADGTRGERT